MRRFHRFSELMRHQCGWVGVRVGEAAGSVDEELLDHLQQDLVRGGRRRVWRRVIDSDRDVPVTIAEPDEGPLMFNDEFGRFIALVAPVEARGRDCRDTQVDNDGESDME